MNDGPSRGPDGSEIEVFATGSTLAVVIDPTETAETTDDAVGMSAQVRRGGEAVRSGYQHARDFHARPGHRLGENIAAISARRGGDTDIVRPVLVNPFVASELAVSGRLFAEPIPQLDIMFHDHDPDEARYLVWTTSVRCDRGRPIPATLHLLASPSMVVTVLELVPSRRLRWGCDRFVGAGIGAIEVLARRLERESSSMSG